MGNDPTTSRENLELYNRPLDDLFSRFATKRFAPDDVLFREGEAPDGVYQLRSGVIDLVNRRADGTERRRAARAGEVLGMPAVISGQRHLSSAVARTPCEIAFIDSDAFRRLVNDQASIWFSVLRQLSQDVNDSYEVMRNAALSRGRGWPKAG